MATVVAESEFAWGQVVGARTSPSFSVLAGDLVVVYAAAEAQSVSWTISGGSLTWTLRQEVNPGGNFARVAIWTALVDVNKSMAVTLTPSISTQMWGANVLVLRGHDGVGNSAKANAASGAPSLSISVAAGSELLVAAGDWNAIDNAGNRVPNHSFEQDVTGWSSDGSIVPTTFAAQTGWAHKGQGSARLTITDVLADRNSGVGTPTGTSGIPVTGGSSVSLSARVNVLSAPAGGANPGVFVRVLQYNSSGALVATTEGARLTGTGLLNPTLTTTLAATAAYVSVSVQANSGGGGGTYDLYFDEVIFRPTATLRTWTNPGATDERHAHHTNNRYSTASARMTGLGAAGAKTVGMSAPSGQAWSLVALEVKNPADASSGRAVTMQRYSL